MEGVKWLKNIAEQLNPAGSVEAADSLNTAFPCSLSCISRSVALAGAAELLGKSGAWRRGSECSQSAQTWSHCSGETPRDINSLNAISLGLWMQFLHSIFLLDKSKCFLRWWLAPAPCGSSWTGFKLYVVFCYKSFYLTPLPLFPSPPFKFFIVLMLPLQRLSNSFSLNTFGCSSEIGLEEKWFQAENLKRLYMSSVQRLKSSELL